MIKQTIMGKKKERNLFVILFLLSIIFSNIGIPSIENSNMMPNYFIALITACILNKSSSLNIYKLVIIGLIVDLFVGQLLGQYGLIFICIYLVYFTIQRILVIKTTLQLFSLGFFLILFSFFMLWATSASHGLFIPFNLLFAQSILTFITYLIFNIFIKKFTAN
jgi:rod shape-determining protein MreD